MHLLTTLIFSYAPSSQYQYSQTSELIASSEQGGRKKQMKKVIRWILFYEVFHATWLVLNSWETSWFPRLTASWMGEVETVQGIINIAIKKW